jgi:hypothetical protein
MLLAFSHMCAIASQRPTPTLGLCRLRVDLPKSLVPRDARDVLPGVHLPAAQVHLKMEVRAGAVARAAHQRNDVSLLHTSPLTEVTAGGIAKNFETLMKFVQR